MTNQKDHLNSLSQHHRRHALRLPRQTWQRQVRNLFLVWFIKEKKIRRPCSWKEHINSASLSFFNHEHPELSFVFALCFLQGNVMYDQALFYIRAHYLKQVNFDSKWIWKAWCEMLLYLAMQKFELHISVRLASSAPRHPPPLILSTDEKSAAESFQCLA